MGVSMDGGFLAHLCRVPIIRASKLVSKLPYARVDHSQLQKMGLVLSTMQFRKVLSEGIESRPFFVLPETVFGKTLVDLRSG